MTFKDLTQLTDKTNFHETLLDHADIITAEIGLTSKTEVADRLKMPKSVFTTAYLFIRAEVNRKNR